MRSIAPTKPPPTVTSAAIEIRTHQVSHSTCAVSVATLMDNSCTTLVSVVGSIDNPPVVCHDVFAPHGCVAFIAAMITELYSVVETGESLFCVHKSRVKVNHVPQIRIKSHCSRNALTMSADRIRHCLTAASTRRCPIMAAFGSPCSCAQ